MRIKKIIARTTDSNIASKKVLNKDGFSYVGVVEEDKILFEKIVKS